MTSTLHRHDARRWTRTGLAALSVLLWVAAPSAAEEHRLQASSDGAIVHLSRTNGTPRSMQRVDLERGKSVVLETGFSVKRVSVGDPEIADVVVLGPRELQLVGRTIGDTNVIVWDGDGRLEAALDLHVGRPHSRIEAELRRVLDNDTLSADGAGESVILKGVVANPAEMERTLNVASAFFPKDASGKSGSDDDGTRVINLLEVGGDQQVMLEVVVAEMSRNLRRNLSTNFAGIEGGGENQTQIFSLLQNLVRLDNPTGLIELSSQANLVTSIARGSDQLDIFVEAIQEDGLAKILAEPNLVARSGEAATFLVGGEVPIPVPQAGAFGVITIQFKQFGVGLTFTPTVMSRDRIHLSVATEVSEPDLTLTTQLQGIVVPAFTTRRASTGVELGDGQSFAMAGLLQENVKELAHQFPGLGDIPILGALFRSTRFEKKETELVIIVTPRLVRPQPAGSFALPTDHFVEPSIFEFFFLGSLEGGVLNRFANESSAWQNFSRIAGFGSEDATDTANVEVGTADRATLAQSRTGAPAGFAGPVGHRIDVWDAQEDVK